MNHLRAFTLIVCLATVLVSCSSSSDPVEPTVAPTATMAPTVSPGGTTVGQVLDQANIAWTTTQSMRTTFWTTADGQIEIAPATGEVTVESIVAPDRRHAQRFVNGEVVEEQIAVSGRIFMRGQIVVAAIAPMIGPTAWIEVDPQAASSTAAISAQVGWLLSPVQSPFATISAETRSLEAFPGDPIEIGGRTCQTWTFGDPEGIQQELALDERNLPCRLLQTAGNVANVTLYEFSPAGLTIEIPEVATPTAP